MERSNPYEVSGSQENLENTLHKRADAPVVAWYWKVLWATVYAYPVIVVLGIYACWLVGWATLGHQPRPMRDDPKGIGGAMDIAYLVSVVMFAGLPAAVPLGLAASFTRPPILQKRWTEGFCLAILYALMCVGVFVLLRWDPADVIEWYMD